MLPVFRYWSDPDWCVRFFPAEGAVVYHRHTGEMHALDQVAAFLFSRLVDRPEEIVSLTEGIREAFPEIVLGEEDVAEILSTLCQAGMVRLCQSEHDLPT